VANLGRLSLMAAHTRRLSFVGGTGEPHYETPKQPRRWTTFLQTQYESWLSQEEASAPHPSTGENSSLCVKYTQ